jgi:hypothetical protein
MSVDIGQIQAIGAGIDLQMTAALARRGDHPLEIDAIRLALADQTASRMADDGDMTVVDRTSDPLGLRLARELETVMHGCHDDIESGEYSVGKIKTTVWKNVDLDAFEHREAIELVVESSISPICRDNCLASSPRAMATRLLWSVIAKYS